MDNERPRMPEISGLYTIAIRFSWYEFDFNMNKIQILTAVVRLLEYANPFTELDCLH